MSKQVFSRELIESAMCSEEKAQRFRAEGKKIALKDEEYGDSIICYILKDLIMLDRIIKSNNAMLGEYYGRTEKRN